MLSSAKIIGFVPTGDLARAKSFYSGTLGFRVTGEDAFAVTLDANGTMVRVAKTGAHPPAPFTILGWEVADIREAAADLERRGVRLERFEGLPQDDQGIWTLPNGAKVGWFKDGDGNILSITQFA